MMTKQTNNQNQTIHPTKQTKIISKGMSFEPRFKAIVRGLNMTGKYAERNEVTEGNEVTNGTDYGNWKTLHPPRSSNWK